MQITIRKGSSFLWTLRPETAAQKYIPITAITMTKTGVRLAAEDHGMVEGWRCRVSRCKGLTRLNTVDEDRPRSSDYFQATVIDADTVEINSRNTTGDKPYTGGGILQYGVPMDLTDCVVRAQIRQSVGSDTVLLDLAPYITIDVPLCLIDFDVPQEITAGLPGLRAVVGIEIEGADESVIALDGLDLILIPEIVRDE